MVFLSCLSAADKSDFLNWLYPSCPLASAGILTVQSRISCFEGILFALSTAQDDSSLFGFFFPVCNVP